MHRDFNEAPAAGLDQDAIDGAAVVISPTGVGLSRPLPGQLDLARQGNVPLRLLAPSVSEACNG